MHLEDLVNLITADLNLNEAETQDFIHQLSQLVGFNLLSVLYDQLSEDQRRLILDWINNFQVESLDQAELDKIMQLMAKVGVDQQKAHLILDSAIRKSLFDLVNQLEDDLTSQTKNLISEVLLD